jgi:uncharacterized LabA/DUF88 family protein
MKKRVVAFIDGFNVYHSVAELGQEFNHLKWLDLKSLVSALIHPNRDELAGIEYFSAEAHWNPADKMKRHSDYISALELNGVNTHIGAFKSVRRTCTKCRKSFKAFEENGTDVAIAAAMVKFAHENRFDKALLFSADSDLVPIIRSIRNSHPDKEIFIVTTKSRIRNAKELRETSNGLISIDEGNFRRNLFPQTIIVGGETVNRPAYYDPPVD